MVKREEKLNILKVLIEERKKKENTQKELAVYCGVTNSTVSKWEQGLGYPEIQTVLKLSSEFQIPLDDLMEGEKGITSTSVNEQTLIDDKKIRIISSKENCIVSCSKICSSVQFHKKKKNEPQFALFGVDGINFWGENRVLLGWYENEEKLKAEIDQINQAIQEKKESYELQFNSKVKMNLFNIKIDSSNKNG